MRLKNLLKYGLLVLLLTHSTIYSVGQTVAPAAGNSAVARPREVVAADSTQAVHRLFQERRRRYRLATGFGGVFSAVWFVVAINTDRTVPGVVSTAASGAGAGFAMGSIYMLRQYSKKREQRLLQDWQAGQPLPAYVKVELTEEYFK